MDEAERAAVREYFDAQIQELVAWLQSQPQWWQEELLKEWNSIHITF